MNKLIRIETENIDLAWNDAKPYIQSSLKLTPEYTYQYIHHLLKSGALTLWIFYNENTKKPFGAMVTEVVEHPQMTILVIFLMSADDFDLVAPLFAPFLEYAKAIGAASIECLGRFGLEKILGDLGFKKSYIVMRFDVN